MLTEQQKKTIYNILAESYIDMVTKGIIGKVERKAVSRRILESVEKAGRFEDVYAFLDSLVQIYPDFSVALVKVKGEINKVHEGQVMSHLKSFLKSAGK